MPQDMDMLRVNITLHCKVCNKSKNLSIKLIADYVTTLFVGDTDFSRHRIENIVLKLLKQFTKRVYLRAYRRMLDQFELIKQGAEARIHKGTYLGKQVIIKERFPKKYRIPELDTTLTKERIKAEAKAIVKCKTVGIPTPCLYLVDFKRRIIIMEYFENSVTVKDFIEASSKEQRENIAFRIGVIIGKMHANNIIHGDLTTSNILLVHDKEDSIDIRNSRLVPIDFGLSHIDTSTEDKGVDLYVLERALISTHSTADEIFPKILEGYRKGNKGGCKEVLNKFEEVRARGRKRTMVG